MSQLEPIPMTITNNGDGTATLSGSTADVIFLKVVSEYTDRTALKHIRRIWGVDLPTAKLMLKAAREGTEVEGS